MRKPKTIMCRKCKTTVPIETKKCPNCGADIIGPAAKIIVGAIVILIIVGLYNIFDDNKGSVKSTQSVNEAKSTFTTESSDAAKENEFSSDSTATDLTVPEETPKEIKDSDDKTEPKIDMSLYEDIPIASNFTSALEEVDMNAKQYFLDKHNVDWIKGAIENVFVSGSENDSTIEVLIQISKNHELLKGQVMTFRNTAVDMVQEAGLTKMPDGMRKVKVRILWTDTATETYIFEYGVGWDKEVQ